MSQHDYTEDPGFREQRHDRDEELEGSDTYGQVSEASDTDPADPDVPPADVIVGTPDDESDEGSDDEAGPDAAPEDDRRANPT